MRCGSSKFGSGWKDHGLTPLFQKMEEPPKVVNRHILETALK